MTPPQRAGTTERQVTWLIVTVLVLFVALVAYAFGKYWLGLGRFREHLRSINWSAFAGVPDWWNWAVNPLGLIVGLALVAFTGAAWWSVALLPILAAVCSVWANFDPGFHFTSAGMMLRLGPFVAGAQGDDSN